MTTQGVGAYGSGGFPAYTGALASGANTPTAINSNNTALAISAATTTGSLKFGTNATLALTFTNGTTTGGTDVLNLALGGLLSANNNNAVNIGTATNRGIITAGGASPSGTVELVTYQNQGITTIESVIQDNGSSPIRLVKSGAGTLTLTAANTYTGGTVVDQGVLTFSGAVASIVPGNLTINNATVTETAAGQIAAASDVTMNGGGTLTMVGTNTLKSLTFGNIAAASSVAGATSLTLSAASAITATNDNLNFTPTVSGTALLFTNAAPVINVSGSSPNGLSITAPITSAGGAISKTGTGSLVLAVANTFATGVNLDAGALIVDHNSALGAGALAIANGTALMSGTAVRTLNNAVSVAGNFTFGALTPDYGTAVANNGVILSNTVTLAAGAHQIAVDGLLNTSTISGKLTGGTNLTKAGPGTLVLSNATNDFGGTTTVTGGTLKSGVNNALTSTTDLSISAGAAFDTGGFAQSLSTLSGAGLVSSSGVANTLTVGNSTPTNATFSGVITGVTPANMALTKVGTNTQTLSGTNTYNGITTVSDGTLRINGSNTGSGLISVASVATLGGTGSIAGGVNVTGMLSPGASIESLASGALTMNNASKFIYEAANNTATGADLMVVNGALSLTGVTLDLSAANLGLGTWASGDKLTLISYTGTAINSGFTGYTDDTSYTGGVFGMNQWMFNYNDTAKGANFSADANGSSFVTLTAVTIIPEPDVAMLVGGLGVMALLRRRRNA